MRRYAKKIAAIGFLVFLVLWIVATIQGMGASYPPPTPMPILFSDSDKEYSRSNANYANNLKQIGLVETSLPLVLDGPGVEKIRILEKRATMVETATDFATKEAEVRASIEEYSATVFNEKSSGIEPDRKVTLEIGVNPDHFKSLVDKLSKITHLSSISVEQKDRTSEFRKLFAQRQSLKKYLEAITKLRDAKNMTFEDSLKLEQKIQDLEKELENLTVQFGDLLGKESYYHVHLTLVEYQPGDSRDTTYTIPKRLFNAFWWAIIWWFGVAFVAALIAATAVSIVVLRQKA